MGTPTGKALVIDDEQKMCRFLELVLSQDGYKVVTATSGEQALDIMRSRTDLDVIVTDLMMPGITGMEVLEEAKRLLPDTPVIMITGYSTVENAVQAMKAGAFDYLPKPFKVDEVKLVVNKALDRRAITLENERLRREIQAIRERSGEIIGTSESMQEVFRLVEKIARTDATTLIRGESGTGKDLIAREIHMQSLRSTKPFVSINCAALPETLLESELFGHARGAFTGAVMTKLLRFLQNREFIRVGETTVRCVDVRVIVATNKDLEAAIERGDFRSDLYYRLNVITIYLPPLRERRSDIPLLAKHFARKFAAKCLKGPISFSHEAMDALVNYDWPGNVRELENAIERALILMEGDDLEISDLPDEVIKASEAGESKRQGHRQDECFYEAVDEYKRELINEALGKSDGVQAKAAEILGLKRTTLNEMMKRLGI